MAEENGPEREGGWPRPAASGGGEAAREEIASLEILGVFLSVFGTALLVAIFFTKGERVALTLGRIQVTAAQLANLVCGLLILGIGSGMFFAGRAIRRRSRGTRRP